MKKTLSQILKQSFYELNESYMQFLTALAVQLFLLFAAFLLLPPFNIILTFLVFVITLIGMARYSMQVLNKKKPQIETVAKVNKNSLSHIITFIVKVFQSIFFAMFLIIPGIIKWLQYSQTAYVLAQNEKLPTLEALTESKKLTQGELGKILLLKAVHLFVSIVLIAFTASVIIITKAFVPISRDLTLIWLFVMSGILMASVVMPFAAVSNTILYENLKLTNKFNDTPKKTFLQEVAQDFITAFSKKTSTNNKLESKTTNQTSLSQQKPATAKTSNKNSTNKTAASKTVATSKITNKKTSLQNNKRQAKQLQTKMQKHKQQLANLKLKNKQTN